MRYRTQILAVGALVALPLLLLVLAQALQDIRQREERLGRERVVAARAAAAAVEGFLESDLTALRALAALPALRTYPTQDGAQVEETMRAVLDATPALEAVGLIDLEGWNVRSLTRHVAVPPRSVNVSDRAYFQEALRSRAEVVSSVVISRVRPDVPVVAVAVPIHGTEGGAVTGVLVGTLSLERVRRTVETVLPDQSVRVILVDNVGQTVVESGVDPSARRELDSLAERPDVAALLRGETGSQRVQLAGTDESVLVSYAPVPSVGWGILYQEPVDTALAPARSRAIRSLGVMALAILLGLGLGTWLSTRLGRAYEALHQARQEAELGQKQAAFLAESSHQLAASLDYLDTLRKVADLAIPMLGDWCVIDLVEEDGVQGNQRVAVACASPEDAELALLLQQRPPTPLQAAAEIQLPLQRRQPLLIERLDEAFLARTAHDPTHLALLQQMRLVSLLMVPLHSPRGVLGVITLATSRSGRVFGRAERELATELADRASLAIENARLFSEAQAAIRARDEFLTSASHDLRTPLASIKLQAQLLGRRARAGRALAPPELAEIATRLDRIASRAGALVNDLLDVAISQSGRPLTLQTAPVDLTRLVSETVTDLAREAPGHQLRLALPEEPLVGAWDSDRLRRVIENLVGNAIKYSPTGGSILVQLTLEEGEGPEVVLRIEDQGIGIPAADLPHIFDRFRRGTNVSEQIAGTGIGLASTRTIVESYGGRIHVTSEEGRGTCVEVRIPRG